ncbi:MAG: septum site-determining protein MinC [Anaerolineae bacterium]|nr:septum site-determining protein MinC [Anaerolineae bacterium]
MRPLVQIKGIREGLLVTLGEGNWPEVLAALLAEVEKQADFLRGAKLILDVKNHILNAATLGKLRDLLSEEGLSLWAVLSHSPTTEQTAQALGLATRIHQPHPEAESRPMESNLDGDAAILIKRTLRSGNSITHTGHITVIGDVNPGAEIVAGGDIVVWGRLRGMAHAGAEGDESAIVCALDLSPTQLRIAGKIAVPPRERGAPKPEIALIRDEEVVAELWQIIGNKKEP